MAVREYETKRRGEAPEDAAGSGDGSIAAGRGHLDLPFLVLTLIMLAIGVVMILSASFARAYYTQGDPMRYFMRQTGFAGLGVALMLITSRVRVSMFRRAALPVMILSIVLLAIVPVVGAKINGARRWIDLGVTTFQPSEIAKLAEILLFSSMICAFKKRMRTFKYGVAPFVVVVALLVALLYIEPHISASVIVVAIAAIMMFAGGTRLRWFAACGALLAGGAYLTVTRFAYASERITAWLDPESVSGDQGYQIIQSLYAIGSGGLFGLGLGQGRQKYLYLPMEHNDYIFSVYCEELGFIGAILVLALFAMLIIRGYWLALHARDRFGSLVVTGITSLLALQVFLNIAVVTNMLPSTGISLPFFSYGGTALLLQLFEMGIILAISREIPVSGTG
ncbi:MAG: putative lipid II flippase FtsW [Oscillospiraceae bacterium]|nr:putative lipid II flippase FtsW [Oscillospiraceae bacterium]